ncbi:nephrin [Synchiropus splendidus]|uniref:nephrin n=1 Tax=Synchiropus splendidus TaxID=270530 RepID=UPI00237EBA99|nr:nephrin [Synchiropus splendidus]
MTSRLLVPSHPMGPHFALVWGKNMRVNIGWSQEAEQGMLSAVHISPLGQFHLRIDDAQFEDEASYECQAAQSESSTAIMSSSAWITMQSKTVPRQVPPSRPHFEVSVAEPWVAGRKYAVVCVATDAKPEADITLFKDGVELTGVESVTTSGSKDKLLNTHAQVTVIPLSTDNGKLLTCRAKNPALLRPVESSMTMSVYFPPQPPVIVGLEKDEVSAGRTILLKCVSVGGNPLATLHWTKNGEVLSKTWEEDSVAQKSTSEIRLRITPEDNQGDNGGMRTTSNVTHRVSREEDGLTLTCEAFNKGTRFSKVHTSILRVYYPPQRVWLEGPPEDVPLHSGTTVRLICFSSGGNPAGDLIFYKNGRVVDAMKQTAFDRGVTRELLLVLSATDNMATYRCDATNEAEQTISAQTRLMVYYPALSMSIRASEEHPKRGQTITLECLSGPSNPAAEVTWSMGTQRSARVQPRPAPADPGGGGRRGRHPAPGLGQSTRGLVRLESPAGEAGQREDSARLLGRRLLAGDLERDQEGRRGLHRPVLQRRGRQPHLHHPGRPICSQRGSREESGVCGSGGDGRPDLCGRRQPRDAGHVLLDLAVKPELLRGVRWRKVASRGDQTTTAEVACRAEGVPRVEFFWQKNGVPMDFVHPRYAERTLREGSFYTSTVQVVNVSALLDYAVFTCIARNFLGEDKLDVQLVSPSHPDPPSMFQLVTSTHDSVTLEWTPGFDGGLRQRFRIRYVWGRSLSFQYVDVFPPTASIFSVTGLHPLTTYNFSLNALNKMGESSYADSDAVLSVTTKERPQLEEAPVDSDSDSHSVSVLPTYLTVTFTLLFGVLLALNSVGCYFGVRWKRNRAAARDSSVSEGKKAEDERSSQSTANNFNKYESGEKINATAQRTLLIDSGSETDSNIYESYAAESCHYYYPTVDYVPRLAPHPEEADGSRLSQDPRGRPPEDGLYQDVLPSSPPPSVDLRLLDQWGPPARYQQGPGSGRELEPRQIQRASDLPFELRGELV